VCGSGNNVKPARLGFSSHVRPKNMLDLTNNKQREQLYTSVVRRGKRKKKT